MQDPVQITKVRCDRYIKMTFDGLSMVKDKPLFFSWFLDGNGLPESKFLIIPERTPSITIKIKPICGWLEIEKIHCKAPEFEVNVEMVLAKMNDFQQNRKANPIDLRFFLVETFADDPPVHHGDFVASVIAMSSKCENKKVKAMYFPKQGNPAQRTLTTEQPIISTPVYSSVMYFQ